MTLEQEMKQAQEKYGHYNSTHEVYGVLKEEVDEFWELVKWNPENDYGNGERLRETKEIRRKKMIAELLQIAAVATRAANELGESKINHV